MYVLCAVLEPIVVFAMGYLSYILADLFAFSGIVRYTAIMTNLWVQYIHTYKYTVYSSIVIMNNSSLQIRV